MPNSLDQLFGDLATDPTLGLISPNWRRRGNYTFPIGIVDRPLEQRRDVFVLRLAGAAGHVAIVGGPRSGRSTFARTLVSSTALTTTPQESQFYVLDFGGGTFTPRPTGAHGEVANRNEPEVVRRTVAEIKGIVDRRESYFRRHGIDSSETYRRRRAEGKVDDGYGDVFLVVDGWPTVRAGFDELEQDIRSSRAGRASPSASTPSSRPRGGWTSECSFATSSAPGSSWASETPVTASEIDRKQAANVPKGRPGRGLTMSKHHFLSAIPRIDNSGRSRTSVRASTRWLMP